MTRRNKTLIAFMVAALLYCVLAITGKSFLSSVLIPLVLAAICTAFIWRPQQRNPDGTFGRK